jgi:hypothetical protein
MEEARFAVGDRVRLSEIGRQKARKRERIGVVIGISRTGTQIRVKWDDLQLPYVVHWSYLEHADTSGGT